MGFLCVDVDAEMGCSGQMSPRKGVGTKRCLGSCEGDDVYMLEMAVGDQASLIHLEFGPELKRCWLASKAGVKMLRCGEETEKMAESMQILGRWVGSKEQGSCQQDAEV